jgi:hypothetical protein
MFGAPAGGPRQDEEAAEPHQPRRRFERQYRMIRWRSDSDHRKDRAPAVPDRLTAWNRVGGAGFGLVQPSITADGAGVVWSRDW